MLGADDALDVFGVHGVGGILGALLTGVFAAPSLGGQGVFDYVTGKVGDYSIASQVLDPGEGRRHHDPLVRDRRLRRLQDRRPGDRSARLRGRGARRPRHQLARRIGLPHVGVAGRNVHGPRAMRGRCAGRTGTLLPGAVPQFLLSGFSGRPQRRPVFFPHAPIAAAPSGHRGRIEEHQRVVQPPPLGPGLRCRWRRRAAGGRSPSPGPRCVASPSAMRPASTSIRSCQRRASSLRVATLTTGHSARP